MIGRAASSLRKALCLTLIGTTFYSTLAVPLVEAKLWEERKAAASQAQARAASPLLLAHAGQPGISAPPLSSNPVLSSLQDSDWSLSSPAADVRLPGWAAALPAAWGSIRRAQIFDPQAPVVLLIQDAHQIEEAQRNIAAALGHLQQSAGKPILVGMEGSVGAYDFDSFRALPDREALGLTADFLIGQSLINGAEFFALTADALPALWGLEDETLYLRNIEAYRRSVAHAEQASRWISDLERGLAAEKQRSFSPSLRNFDSALERLDAGGGFTAFWSEIPEAAQRVARGFPELRKLSEAIRLERSLDSPTVEQERKELISLLARRMSSSELEGLARLGLAYRMQRVDHARYYAALTSRMAHAGVKIGDYPFFERYVRYVAVSCGVRAEDLHRELDHFRDAAGQALSRNPDEKQLMRLSEALRQARKLTRHELSSVEWPSYLSRKADVESLPAEISSRDGVSSEIDPQAWKDMLASYEAYFTAALARDRALGERMVARLKAEDGNGSCPAVMISGGFHTPGIEAELEKRRISYVTWMPRVGRVQEPTRYLEFFSTERTPLDRMLLGEKLFMGATTPFTHRIVRGFQYVGDKVLPAARAVYSTVTAFRHRKKRMRAGETAGMSIERDSGKPGEQARYAATGWEREYDILLTDLSDPERQAELSAAHDALEAELGAVRLSGRASWRDAASGKVTVLRIGVGRRVRSAWSAVGSRIRDSWNDPATRRRMFRIASLTPALILIPVVLIFHHSTPAESSLAFSSPDSLLLSGLFPFAMVSQGGARKADVAVDESAGTMRPEVIRDLLDQSKAKSFEELGETASVTHMHGPSNGAVLGSGPAELFFRLDRWGQARGGWRRLVRQVLQDSVPRIHSIRLEPAVALSLIIISMMQMNASVALLAIPMLGVVSNVALNWSHGRGRLTREARSIADQGWFDAISEGVYPSEPIAAMLSDGYDPVIIGYDHGNPANLVHAQAVLQAVQNQNPGRKIRAGLEMSPQRFEWVLGFFDFERRFYETGIYNGEVVTDPRFRQRIVDELAEYRSGLTSSFGGALALWMLEHGFEIVMIEDERMEEWIQSDSQNLPPASEEDLSSLLAGGMMSWSAVRPFYTGVRREISSLARINSERPDVLCVGTAHALKYDFLLRRDGDRTFYYDNFPNVWFPLRVWERIHSFIRSRQQNGLMWGILILSAALAIKGEPLAAAGLAIIPMLSMVATPGPGEFYVGQEIMDVKNPSYGTGKVTAVSESTVKVEFDQVMPPVRTTLGLPAARERFIPPFVAEPEPVAQSAESRRSFEPEDTVHQLHANAGESENRPNPRGDALGSGPAELFLRLDRWMQTHGGWRGAITRAWRWYRSDAPWPLRFGGVLLTALLILQHPDLALTAPIMLQSMQMSGGGQRERLSVLVSNWIEAPGELTPEDRETLLEGGPDALNELMIRSDAILRMILGQTSREAAHDAVMSVARLVRDLALRKPSILTFVNGAGLLRMIEEDLSMPRRTGRLLRAQIGELLSMQERMPITSLLRQSFLLRGPVSTANDASGIRPYELYIRAVDLNYELLDRMAQERGSIEKQADSEDPSEVRSFLSQAYVRATPLLRQKFIRLYAEALVNAGVPGSEIQARIDAMSSLVFPVDRGDSGDIDAVLGTGPAALFFKLDRWGKHRGGWRALMADAWRRLRMMRVSPLDFSWLQVSRGTFKPDIYTEVLIRGLMMNPARRGQSVLVIGTGSGADAILQARQGARVDVIDVNSSALTDAAQNARQAGLASRIRVFEHNGVEGLGRYDRIVWNAPEPHPRFQDGNYNLRMERLRQILMDLPNHLNPGGSAIFRVNHTNELWNRFFRAAKLDVEVLLTEGKQSVVRLTPHPRQEPIRLTVPARPFAPEPRAPRNYREDLQLHFQTRGDGVLVAPAARVLAGLVHGSHGADPVELERVRQFSNEPFLKLVALDLPESGARPEVSEAKRLSAAMSQSTLQLLSQGDVTALARVYRGFQELSAAVVREYEKDRDMRFGYASSRVAHVIGRITHARSAFGWSSADLAERDLRALHRRLYGKDMTDEQLTAWRGEIDWSLAYRAPRRLDHVSVQLADIAEDGISLPQFLAEIGERHGDPGSWGKNRRMTALVSPWDQVETLRRLQSWVRNAESAHEARAIRFLIDGLLAKDPTVVVRSREQAAGAGGLLDPEAMMTALQREGRIASISALQVSTQHLQGWDLESLKTRRQFLVQILYFVARGTSYLLNLDEAGDRVRAIELFDRQA